jgi:hypothetical protein
LAVPPFDRHADGDGRLRQLGLDRETWQAWVSAVLAQQATLGELARTLGTPTGPGPLLDATRAAARVVQEPGAFCPGGAELKARLNELFADYAPSAEPWQRRMSDVRSLHGSGRQQRALWDALVPFHDRLPTLTVFLVEYPEPVVMPVPPTTCLTAPDADPEAFGRQIVSAATALSADRNRG